MTLAVPLAETLGRIAPADAGARQRAAARHLTLTKPPGSLGRLEEVSIQLAGIYGSDRPAIRSAAVIVAAGDHGVVAQGVTGYPQAVTAQMERRIAAHRARRPGGWDTLEEPFDLAGAAGPIVDRYDTVVIDCVTLWVSNLLLRHEADANAEDIILDAAGRLLDLIERSAATWIVISNEVGLGVVPPWPLG